MYCFANRSYGMMLSTLFRSPTGKVVVVDGGWPYDAEALLIPALRALGGTVEAWFLTHAHYDHYGALDEILKRPDHAGIRIGRVVHHFLPPAFLAEVDPGCLAYVSPFLERLAASGIPVETPTPGEVFDFGEGLSFECLNDYDPAVRENAINESSICYRVQNGGSSILVTGDIATRTAARLRATLPPEKLKADVCFLSHHGQCGADKAFYAAVAPELAIWPSTTWLWENDADDGNGPGSGGYLTNYTKVWLQEIGVRCHVVLTRDAAFGPK